MNKPISTADCKEFISKLSDKLYTVDSDNNWKRTRKYKENDLVLREFKNDSDVCITIAEDNKKLFLYTIVQADTSTDSETEEEYGTHQLESTAKEEDVLAFIRQCVEDDNSIVWPDAVQDALDIKSWTIFWAYTHKNKNFSGEVFPMSEFFSDGQTSFPLQYTDPNGDDVNIDRKDILQVFCVGMQQYETAYRITIFETKNHTLLLGLNDSD